MSYSFVGEFGIINESNKGNQIKWKNKIIINCRKNKRFQRKEM